MKRNIAKKIGLFLAPLTIFAFTSLSCVSQPANIKYLSRNTINQIENIQPKEFISLKDGKTSRLEQRIDKILKPYLNKIDIGIKVVSLKDRKVLYSLNQDKKLIPASSAKLTTALTALKLLGKGYKFETKFYTDGKLEDDIMKGNLYVKGFGDPSIVPEQLWLIAQELYMKGIREIRGDIIADTTFFDREKYNPGYYENLEEEDYSQAYNAPHGALSFNFNRINVHVKPGKKSGDKAVILSDPKTSYAKIINNTKTTSGRTNLKIIRKKDEDVIIVKGKIGTKTEDYTKKINISEPSKYFTTVLKECLGRQGIKVYGELKEGIVPEGSYEILTHESKPLSLIIRDLCKYSNNVIADNTLKTLAAMVKGEPGTAENGVAVIKEFLSKIGIEGLELVDGSGYCSKDKLTADHLVKILEYAYNDFDIFPEFLSALPISGTDGTLRRRMDALEGYARAKTGFLGDHGTRALAGYVKTENGDILAFSILMNSKKSYMGQMKILIDEKILPELVKVG